ncbi:MAG TPA: TPM domain-containing protein, partial [Candidatus Acidoferrum sp.]|nr:TPM domain-containing protein [Candidatus Acidoferrum sp.]
MEGTHVSMGLRHHRLTTIAAVTAAALLVLAVARVSIAAGPPYPDPIPGIHVYDTADALTGADIGAAEKQIQAIEARTGAQIVVYTQVKPESDTPEAAEADAAALGTQWGVGRKGFDDGLVILFDLEPNLCHGQVQLYAAKGFAAAFLSNSDRQRIYEDTMLPDLRACRLGAALAGALEQVDQAATPEHAANLERARQIDAVLGL